MSFSTEIKKELSELNNLTKKEEVKYELLGYLLSNNVTEEKNKIRYSTENEYNINRFAKLLKNMNINDFTIDIQGKIYNIMFKKNKIEEIKFEKIEEIENIEYLKSLIRGIYLGSGSINNPENKYHLEIELSKKEVKRTADNPRLNNLSQYYLDRYSNDLHIFHDIYNDNIIDGFKHFQDLGVLEIITCGATHGFFPILYITEQAVKAQIAVRCSDL